MLGKFIHYNMRASSIFEEGDNNNFAAIDSGSGPEKKCAHSNSKVAECRTVNNSNWKYSNIIEEKMLDEQKKYTKPKSNSSYFTHTYSIKV